MTISIIFVLFALAFASALCYLARGVVAPRKSSQLLAVDIQAFRNLMDPSERDYLKQNLPARDFRSLHRARQLAALEYVSAVAKNAATLLVHAQQARLNHDPQIAEAAAKLVEDAIQLRINAAGATARIYLGLVFPPLANLPETFGERYERLTSHAMRLDGLRFREAETAA